MSNEIDFRRFNFEKLSGNLEIPLFSKLIYSKSVKEATELGIKSIELKANERTFKFFNKWIESGMLVKSLYFKFNPLRLGNRKTSLGICVKP